MLVMLYLIREKNHYLVVVLFKFMGKSLFFPKFILLYRLMRYKIYGHRGCRALLNENTLLAHNKALYLGVDMIDMDIMLTKDNIPIVFHDNKINNRNTYYRYGNYNYDKYIGSLTYQQLQDYYVGYPLSNRDMKLVKDFRFYNKCPIPSLKNSIINLINYNSNQQTNIGIQLELKTEPTNRLETPSIVDLCNNVYQVLVDTDVLGKMPIEIQGFEWTTLVTMKKNDINNNCHYSFVTDNQLLSTIEFQRGLWTHHLLPCNYNHLIDMIKHLNGNIWCPYEGDITITDIEYAHHNNIKVVVWSSIEYSKKDINIEKMRELIDWNVDGIITDRPDKVYKLLNV